MDQSERIVDTMGAIHGVHPGFRAVHAKGICCKGSFTATRNASALCSAPHFQGDSVPVTVRFSNGSGKPTRADGARDERGMAVKFHLPEGRTTDIVSLTLPVFFVKTPEDFLSFLEAQIPDPATGKTDVSKVTAFVDEHPETQTAIGFSMFSMAPASYAACTFHAIHAFKMTAPDGSQRFVRYHWIPDLSEEPFSDEKTRALGREYLRDDLARRLADSTIGFDLHIQLAEDGDDITDPTVAWPDERETIVAGSLTLDEFAGTECEPAIFDPLRLVDGIEPSDDPILHARSPAYGVSFERRTAAGAEAHA